MRHDEKEIDSIGTFIDKLDAQRSEGELLWFRGQCDFDWDLTPSIWRHSEDPIAYEWALYKRFRQNAGRLAEDRPTTEWEWYLLMQHVGVPTRLLDWTESPLTALYFAVADGEKETAQQDAALWVISPCHFNKHVGFDLTVSNDLPCIGLDEELSGYRIDRVRQDSSVLNPVAAIAPRQSARMAAQHGVFLVYHGDFTALNRFDDTSFVWKYRIRSNNKKKILSELAVLSITELSLFPELSNAANFAKEMVK